MLPMDVKMAWRNIWRHPRRTLLTTLAIAFACVLLIFMLSFQFGSYEAMISASIKIHTGHLQVQAEGYQEKRKIRRVIEDPQAVQEVLAVIPEVRAMAARARAFALVSSNERSYGIMVEGVEPEAEAQVSTLSSIVQEGVYLDAGPGPEAIPKALMGYLLARNLKVAVGDELTVLSQGRDGSVAAMVVVVGGIYRSGMDEYDRGAIQIPLAVFQEVFAMQGAVHEVVVAGEHLSDVGAIRNALGPSLAAVSNECPLVVLSWDDLLPGLKQAIRMDLVSGGISYLILILVVAFSILNTFLMAIFERTHEFGVLMAIGTRPARLTRLVLIESAGMTLVGILAGLVLGCLLTAYFAVHGIPMGGASEILSQFGIPDTLYPRMTFASVTAGPLAVLLITLAAALYPALKLKRLKPVEALRQE